MEAADPLVVELDRVALFAADGQGGRNILENASPVGPVENPQSDSCHGELPILLPLYPLAAKWSRRHSLPPSDSRRMLDYSKHLPVLPTLIFL